MLCPNCYYFLKGRLNVRMVSVYQKLEELKLGKKITGGGRMFLPCPDREEQAWMKELEDFMEQPCGIIQDIQCCGLGGCARAKEPELSKEMADVLVRKQYDKVYTYCASCSGSFARNGYVGAKHVLTELLGTDERPDTAKSMLNRMKTKFV